MSARCPCGYQAASGGGLRWHLEQGVCRYGGKVEHVNAVDVGREAPPPPAAQVRQMEIWGYEVCDGITALQTHEDLTFTSLDAALEACQNHMRRDAANNDLSIFRLLREWRDVTEVGVIDA